MAIALLLFLLWIALLAVPGAWVIFSIYTVSVTKTVLVCSALAVALTLVGLCWWHHWISGATMLCGLIAVALLASQPTVAKSPSRRVADVAQLIYYRDALLRQVAELQRKGTSPAVAAIAVDGFGSMTSGIALDPTGEIFLKPDRRSKSWTATAGQTEIGIETLEARHIVGDYYSWFHY
ncbi:MAG TPA: hypothetical protein VGN07_23490 [Steroidobacteraceae bacterium]